MIVLSIRAPRDDPFSSWRDHNSSLHPRFQFEAKMLGQTLAENVRIRPFPYALHLPSSVSACRVRCALLFPISPLMDGSVAQKAKPVLLWLSKVPWGWILMLLRFCFCFVHGLFYFVSIAVLVPAPFCSLCLGLFLHRQCYPAVCSPVVSHFAQHLFHIDAIPWDPLPWLNRPRMRPAGPLMLFLCLFP